MRIPPILAILTLAAAAASCTKSTSDRDLTYVTPFKAVELMNHPASLLQRAPLSAWVDPRSPEKYAEGHIPGAINLPFPRMTAEAAMVLGKYDLLVVYDTSYDDAIAKAASKRLIELDFKEVYTLEGGLKSWTRDGNPVETGFAAPPADSKNSAPAAK
ncbi:MAG: hypothetical protein K8R92_00600 [Planctomycetes bacterium]|nr:hypothetical protein [Planctomycetota bacterium]